jgi:hypothetical protein
LPRTAENHHVFAEYRHSSQPGNSPFANASGPGASNA